LQIGQRDYDFPPASSWADSSKRRSVVGQSMQGSVIDTPYLSALVVSVKWWKMVGPHIERVQH
jgi:hypothetical protein